MSPDINEVLNFLAKCFNSGQFSYSTMNTIRSALSTFICINGQPVGSHPLVVRFLKGIFAIKPAIPKNVVTWDTSVVLNFLKTLSPVKVITLQQLTYKATTLTALLTSQRCQSLTLIDLRNVSITKFTVKIRFGDLLKQSRPGFQLKELTVKGFPADRRLCLVTVLKEYIQRTDKLRNDYNQLFITIKKPHHPASSPTISRWIKHTLSMAGINMDIFTPHSVRSASSSNAKSLNIPLKSILQTAGWSSRCTFAKFYKKKIVKQGAVAESLLNKTLSKEVNSDLIADTT